MMFSFIAKHRGIWPVALICEALGVARQRDNAAIRDRVRAIFLRT